MKKALIAGITGQDVSYLAEILIEKGYEVHGIMGLRQKQILRKGLKRPLNGIYQID